jgi:hypothetical protein
VILSECTRRFKPAGSSPMNASAVAETGQRFNRSTLQRFNALTNRIDSAGEILPLSEIMRFLAELVIIAALIFLGWNKPFKDQVAQASTTIESKLHGTGSKLQKNQDPSVRRY